MESGCAPRVLFPTSGACPPGMKRVSGSAASARGWTSWSRWIPDLGQDVACIEPGGYPPTTAKPMPRSKFPRGHHGYRRAPDRHLQPRIHRPRQRQLFKNIVYVGALSALLMDVKILEQPSASNSSQGEADRRQRACPASWTRLLMNLGAPSPAPAAHECRGDALHRRQLGRGAQPFAGRHRLRLVSHHPVLVARGRVHRPLPPAAGDPESEKGRDRSG